MDGKALHLQTVLLFSMVNLNLFNQLIEHSRGELSGTSVLANASDEHIGGHRRAGVLVQLGFSILDLFGQLLLLILVVASHPCVTVIGDLSSNVVLVKSFKELVQFLVAGQELAQLPCDAQWKGVGKTNVLPIIIDGIEAI